MSILNLEGAYENELSATGEFNPQAPKTALMLPTGERVVLPTEVLLAALAGTAAPVGNTGTEEAPDHSLQEVSAPAVAHTGGAQDVVIPLLAEELQVGTQTVETGRVRVRRETEEIVQTVSAALTQVHWEVEHVAVGERVDTAPEIRRVGETMIYPLVEERMVVSKELWLREEVHIRRVKTTTEKSADYPVRRDVLVEERSEASDAR